MPSSQFMTRIEVVHFLIKNSHPASTEDPTLPNLRSSHRKEPRNSWVMPSEKSLSPEVPRDSLVLRDNSKLWMTMDLTLSTSKSSPKP